MDAFSSLLAGGLIGVSVAAPVGPMGLLCISRTLRGGMRAGISTGLGASTVQLLYGALALLGMQQVSPWLDGNRHALTLLGGLVMLLFAWRILRPRPVGRAASGQPPSVLHHYASAVLFNSANPLLLVLLVGALGAVFGEASPGPQAVAAVLPGIFLGSLIWWIGLCSATSVLRDRLSLGVLRAVNQVAAASLAAFGALALMRAL